MATGTSIFLIALGAILTFAVEADISVRAPRAVLGGPLQDCHEFGIGHADASVFGSLGRYARSLSRSSRPRRRSGQRRSSRLRRGHCLAT